MIRWIRFYILLVIVTAGLSACIFAPSIGDGNYKCQLQSECPGDLVCEPSIGRCIKRGQVTDGGTSCGKAGESQVCYTGPTGTNGIGECTSGTQICENGSWSDCQGQVVPTEEKCNNNLDDDCNGLIDDGCTCTTGQQRPCYPGPDGTNGVGVCRPGVQKCSNQAWGPCEGAVLPSTELCNGQDDNCNGQVDDVLPRRCYTGPPPTLGQGVCRAGEQRCTDGAWGPCQGQVLPSSSERCNNGRDDNCNGQVDEGCGCKPGEINICYSGPANTQGVGACKSGQQRCDANGRLGPCEGEITPTTETCDGVDNNCDGKVDEGVTERSCYTGPSGTQGKGACAPGRQKCSNGQWSPCVGQILPQKETCDGVDNDCNGSVDEGCECVPGETRECYSGPPQSKGQGNCKAGKQTCTASRQWGPCLGEVTPKAEQCNGIDDDCDGNVDGFSRRCYSGPANTEGKGNCRSGAQTCNAGKWTACQGESLPKDEVCDGIDNNCDGQVDENLSRACYSGKTGCKPDGQGGYTCEAPCAPGKQSCTGGLWSTCVGEVAAQTETCNNKDDDCDGKIDGFSEDCYTASDQGCAPDGQGGYACKGECRNGKRNCHNGQYTICAGQKFVQPESCDGKDNDCNGQIDEGCQCLSGNTRTCYAGPQGTLGKGICKSGTQTCDQFGRWGTCAGQVLPQTETCNGIDDNCDGVIDGMTQACYTGPANTRNKAPCSDGKATCQNGKYGACVGEVKPQTETCNGKDDDCNGKVDDNLTPPKCDKQQGVCAGAVKRCGGAQGWLPCSATDYGKNYQLVESNCDGLDNDCDGKVDGDRACGTCIFSTKAAIYTASLPTSCSPSTHCFDNCLNFQGQLYYCRNTNQKGYQYTTYNAWLSACNRTTACQTSECNGQSNFCDGTGWRQGKPPGTNDDFCDGIDNNCDGKVDEGCTCQSPCTADQYCKGPCKKCVKQPGNIFPTCVP